MPEDPYYKTLHQPLETGYNVEYVTAAGGYHPPHWHEELEILYHLNGDSDITIENKKYHLQKKHMIVVDSRQVHSTYTRDWQSMFICIHISKQYMERFVPGLRQYRFSCTPDDVTDENFEEYYNICKILQDMTEAYVKDEVTLKIQTASDVLMILTLLIQNFSQVAAPIANHKEALSEERIRETIDYVSDHYQESGTLQDIADTLGLSKEYFCRFFKKHMGMTYFRYVDETRLAHAYRDLKMTDDPVSIVMENNGFTNQKLFNRMFKEIYGCTPSQVRKKECTEE